MSVRSILLAPLPLDVHLEDGRGKISVPPPLSLTPPPP
jgi:hypothetical protein